MTVGSRPAPTTGTWSTTSAIERGDGPALELGCGKDGCCAMRPRARGQRAQPMLIESGAADVRRLGTDDKFIAVATAP